MFLSKFFLVVKVLFMDFVVFNFKSQLVVVVRVVIDSINQFIIMCIQQVFGQKECDNVLWELEMVWEFLENLVQFINDMFYFGCLDSVMENLKVLGEVMIGIF